MNKSQIFRKLVVLLKELFQLDRPDLDFGFYRIMHAKSAEVTQFLERDLLPQVKAAFAQYQSADKTAIQKDLDETVRRIESDGADPKTSPKVRELRERLAGEAVDLAALEAEVYDRLYSFFRRHYSEGDFLSKRVYKPGVYAIPYEGEEVKLHWANADQYYIKTSEYLRDYAFRLRPDDEGDPMRVHFRLVDASEGEHGNVKAAEDKKRVFLLQKSDFIAEEHAEDGDELIVRFEYRPATIADWPDADRQGRGKPPTQSNLIVLAEQQVRAVTDPALARWTEALSEPHLAANGEQADYSCLQAHLNRYTARNTFDYFIHKDLDGFLRRELDFYIKNEVMHLDDVENETAPRVEQYLSKIKVIRSIGSKIIDFLAQLEDFQKKLWLKKKFVIQTDYCVTLGHVPESMYQEVTSNASQCEEWTRLFALDDAQPDFASGNISWSNPPTVDFLKANPCLVLDTRHFDSDFTWRLLAALSYSEPLDDQLDGLLVHSENFQALNLMKRGYRERIECVYIDPPYNTGDSEILYKNGYLNSSWLTLMANRLAILPNMFTQDPILYIAIDDFEMTNLAKFVDSEFPSLRREMIIINHHPQGGKAKTLAHTHEYMLACMPESSDRTLIGRKSDDGVELRPFKRSGTAESNFRRARPNSFYAILVCTASREIMGIEEPPSGSAYPIESTDDGLIRVYPIGKQGEERVWRRSYKSCQYLVQNNKLRCTERNAIYQAIEANERASALFSNWIDTRYNAGTHGANLLRDILGEQNPFSYPKSIHTVADAIFVSGLEADANVLDFFAGSGTTGHAVINLNREDGGRRKFILVEMGDHFDTVLLPRIKKVTFAPEWKDGKPKRSATPEEAERSPRIVKVVRLESYEDTLNNLEPRRTDAQQSALDMSQRQGSGDFREQYMLRYMLDVETRGNPPLLNVAAFADPTSYRLKVKRPGSDESREVNVDLLETFNWLIGLRVQRIVAPRTYNANFKRDQEGRLQLREQLRQETNGSWWFRTLTGTLPDGRKALVIWRKRPGGETPEGVERDNLVLNEWFAKQDFAQNGGCDLIYVNGDNNLENLKAPDDLWSVRLIEEDFHRLMFESEEV